MPLKERLERFAIVITGSRDKAKDLTASTVLAAFEGFDRLKNKQAFLSYLFTIAYRLYNKNRSRLARFDATDQSVLDNLKMQEVSPEIRCDINLMMEAINHLDSKYRETLILFYIQGFSQKEIANIMNTSLSNVKLRLFRAKKLVRKELGIEVSENSIRDIKTVSMKI